MHLGRVHARVAELDVEAGGPGSAGSGDLFRCDDRGRFDGQGRINVVVFRDPEERAETPAVKHARGIGGRDVKRRRLSGAERKAAWHDVDTDAGRRGDLDRPGSALVTDVGDTSRHRLRIGELRHRDRRQVELPRLERQARGCECVAARLGYRGRLDAARKCIEFVIADVIHEARIESVVRHDMPGAEVERDGLGHSR